MATRRTLLQCLPLVATLRASEKGRTLPAEAARYLDPATVEWPDSWDSTEDQGKHFNKLPAAVEVTLSVLDGNGATHDFSTIADLVLAAASLPTPTPK